MNLVILLSVLFYKGFAYPADFDPIIEITNGKIRGIELKNVHNRTFYAFLDVPYASPPIRFEEATPAKNWVGILNATQNRKTCWQISSPDMYRSNGPDSDEDCLYANVYISKLPTPNSELYPVIAYIYGGQFAFNHDWMEDYDPQLLVDSGIIYVNFNFRSGPLGFLSTEDDVIPGNLGLKDQNFALKWIQENIRYFGGDPSKVSLVGHSSGAVSVSLHVMSKRSAGLFRSAILQSGSGLCPGISIGSHRYYAYEIGKQLSADFTDRNSSKDLLKLLKIVPVEKLHNVSLSYIARSGVFESHLTLMWAPIVERGDVKNPFLAKPVHEELVKGNFNKLPIMMGITSEESLTYAQVISPRKIAKTIDQIPSSMVGDNRTLDEYKHEMGEKLKSIYTNTTFQENLTKVYRYLSDYSFSIPMIRNAELFSKLNDVYFYQFSFYGEKNNPEELQESFHPINLEGLGNVGHTEELRFLYLRGPKRMERENLYSANDLLTRDRLIRLWTNFVKYSNPTPEDDPLLQNIHWPKVGENGKGFSYLDIDVNLKVHHSYLRDYEKWLQIINRYYKRPINML